jgi:hypothetical protein
VSNRDGVRARRAGHTDSGDGRTLVAALATDARVRVFAAIVLGARRPSEIATASGIDPAGVVAALARLQKAGLVRADVDGFVAVVEVFAVSARASAPTRPLVDFGTSDPAVAGVLGTFLDQGRISTMPAQRSKRRVVLEHVVTVFEPGRRYREPEVNAILASFYDDTATLRRYLVDEHLLDRADGAYWRIGGWVDVLDDPS